MWKTHIRYFIWKFSIICPLHPSWFFQFLIPLCFHFCFLHFSLLNLFFDRHSVSDWWYILLIFVNITGAHHNFTWFLLVMNTTIKLVSGLGLSKLFVMAFRKVSVSVILSKIYWILNHFQAFGFTKKYSNLVWLERNLKNQSYIRVWCNSLFGIHQLH